MQIEVGEIANSGSWELGKIETVLVSSIDSDKEG